MLDALQFVRGAVSTKDLVPVLTHFAFHQGRLHGFNGRVHISAPLPKKFAEYSFTVPAVPFLAAWQEDSDLRRAQTEGFIEVYHGKFCAQLPIGPVEQFPVVELTGKMKRMRGGLIPILRSLRPFIGEDASRAWSSGIHFQGAIALATNNVVLVEAAVPIESGLLSFTLPVFAVDELIRIDVEPVGYRLEEEALTFFLPGGVWVRSCLFKEPWPDAKAVLTVAHTGAALRPVDPELAGAVERLVPFCPDPALPSIRLSETVVKTLAGPTSAFIGGFRGLGADEGTYRAEPLISVLKVARQADWSRFPRVPWTGEDGGTVLSGVLMGLRS